VFWFYVHHSRQFDFSPCFCALSSFCLGFAYSGVCIRCSSSSPLSGGFNGVLLQQKLL
jgi:hypothetical protein